MSNGSIGHITRAVGWGNCQTPLLGSWSAFGIP